MRMFFLPLFILLAVAATHGGVPGDSVRGKVDLTWKPFTVGFTEARQNEKKIMVDVYTNWCGWCKRLDADVYSNPEVVAYMKDHFVSVKLNAESATELMYKDTVYSQVQFAKALGVTGYPTIAFFDSKGDLITKLGGYVAADRFLPIVKFIGEDYYKKMSWDQFQKQLAPQQSDPPNTRKQ